MRCRDFPLSLRTMALLTAALALQYGGRNAARAFVVVQRQQRVLSPRGQKWKLFSTTAATTSTTTTTNTTTTTATATTATTSNAPVQFPLQGKSIQNAPPRLRFAPSPTGSLHVGGARTALYNWLLAQKGRLDFPTTDAGFVLRVEDTDLARSTKESEQSVLQDLKWLGLHWNEGPDTTNAKYGPYRQSERGDLYVRLAQQLLQEGKAYRCFCSNEELEEMKRRQEEEGIPPRYDGTWRDADESLIQEQLDKGTPYTVRFRVPPNARVVINDAVRGTVAWDADATVGDFILLRSNGVPVYNFCVAVDDATMGITTVVRAEEHLTNTLRQALILDALSAPRPRYAHCSLILGQDKQKLSKRHGATSCHQFRLDGFLPDAMINYLALLGWNDGSDNEIFTRSELIEAFELERVVKSPSVFDMDKLKWVNAQHMKNMHVEDLIELVKEQMQWEGLFKEGVDLSTDDRVTQVTFAATALAKQMMETTKDAAINAKQVLGYGLPSTFDQLTDEDAIKMIKVGNFYNLMQRVIEDVGKGVFPQPHMESLLEAFRDEQGLAIEEDNHPGGGPGSYPDAYKKYMKSLVKEFNVHGKNLFHPIRLGLTGEMSGQDVTKQLSLLAMATTIDGVIDAERVGVVSFEERIARLQTFCDSIPEEYRSPRLVKEESKKDAASKEQQQVEGSTRTAPSDPLETYDGPPITALDIRVGRIIKVWEHEEADKLFCEEIDVGDEGGEPRRVASGLRPYMKAQDMEGRLVLVLCNLKERKMVGFPSHGMVLCASNADHTNVRFVSPPVDARVGERVTVPDFDFEGEDAAPFAENKVGKKKVFEKIAPHLVTDRYGVPQFLGRPLMTSAGVCTSPIPDGTVS